MRTAIIVEPRRHNALYFVLNNICDCLTNEWNIVLFHGNNNIEYCNTIVEKLNMLYNNRIQMVNLKIDNLSINEYSYLLSTKSIIYDYIEEIFLIFQCDSMIFKQNAYFINDFLEYDYVGSPWLVTMYIPTKNCGFIGNGGFSLRKKSKMFEIMEKIPYNNINEDLYFSTNYENIIVKKPEYKVASTFSVEEVYNNSTFACHKPWLCNHYELFKQYYPEVEELRLLQNVEI